MKIIFREKNYSLNELTDEELRKISSYKAPKYGWNTQDLSSTTAAGFGGVLAGKSLHKNPIKYGLIGAATAEIFHAIGQNHKINKAKEAKKILDKRKKDK